MAETDQSNSPQAPAVDRVPHYCRRRAGGRRGPTSAALTNIRRFMTSETRPRPPLAFLTVAQPTWRYSDAKD